MRAANIHLVSNPDVGISQFSGLQDSGQFL
jgi:hypothetical protein